MKGDIGFSLGFFCGAILAGVGVYLAAAPEGKKIREELVTEYNRHRKDFTIKALTSETEEIVDMLPLKDSLHTIIHKLRAVINPTPETTPKNNASTHATKRKRYFKSTV